MIVFGAEVGFSFLELLGRTWAPQGRPPLIRRVNAERRGLSTVVGLSLSERIHKQHFTQAINSVEVVFFLLPLLRQHPQRLIVVWDHASIHTANVVEAFVAQNAAIIEVAWLPLYAPDLNPEEGCHGNVKAQLRNLTPNTVSQYRRHVDREFACLRQRPDLILAFFHHAGLSVKRLW